MSNFPNFRNKLVLLEHAQHSMRFYHPRAIDPNGGMYHYFKDDGTVYDANHRHLVSSTRFVFTYAMAYRQFHEPGYLEGLKHALTFLRVAHRAADGSGYAWMLDGDKVEDGTQHAYGLAFVLLAYSHATLAGQEQARAWIGETFELMEKRFWDAEAGLYADEASRDWSVLSTYRGQNANMHACEALQAAYQATGEKRYLERAFTIAYNITQRQAQRCGGLIWEHYDTDWQPDWKFNIDDPENLFRPWGYQPGHFTEWAKLLLQLEARGAVLQKDLGWLLPTAERLFQVAVNNGWDGEHGGLCYSLAPDLTICDYHKYFWVQAESAAAAAMLAQRTGEQSYWDWYQRIWEYSWTHMVDHEHGAWFRILDRENRKLSDEKSPAGKVDYHTMGACYDIVNVLGAADHA